MNGKVLNKFLLFISGDDLISKKAIFNCKKSLDIFFKSDYEMKIIDLFESPKLAFDENIIALPILIRKNPLPELRIIGDMSDLELFKSDLLLT